MTVTIDELEDFISHFHEQNLEKIEDKNMRKAVRHYWNVASQPTVDSRLETLKAEGWIKKKPHTDKWTIKTPEEKESGIEKMFREE